MSVLDRGTKDTTWGLVLAVIAAAVLVPTGVDAAAQVFKLQDGDGKSKAQVDKGAVRVGDGGGALTVDGDVGVTGRLRSSDAELLAYGDCNSQEHTETHDEVGSLPADTTITEIVLTNDTGGGARTTLVIKKPSVLGFTTNHGTTEEQRGGRFMALQIGWQSNGYADFNEVLSFGDGVNLDEPWHFFCTGVVGASQGDGLWSVYGYEA